MEVKKAWTADLERILWNQATHSRGQNNNTSTRFYFTETAQQLSDGFDLSELRLQERVFMGIDRKPFMDIQPSDSAICDRAITCSPPGRSKPLR